MYSYSAPKKFIYSDSWRSQVEPIILTSMVYGMDMDYFNMQQPWKITYTYQLDMLQAVMGHVFGHQE